MCSDVAGTKTQNLEMLLETLLKDAEGLNPSQPSVVSSKVVKLTSNSSKRTLTGRLLVGTAEAIPSAELVDTTGAGDAFIGAVMYCKLDLLSFILSFLVF
jgi:fructose-1-phosphate kinase PfkB-like protein